MNRSFDYNGIQIAPSKPVQKLVKVSKILHVDSGDRDNNFYPQNGDFVVYLPRVYERVVSINIKDAEFPIVTSNLSSWLGTPRDGKDSSYTLAQAYFFMEIEGLNKSDETSLSADRSASADSVFAKFVVSDPAAITIYNESSSAHQTIDFRPAIGRLDRLHFKLRAHGMSKNQTLYWKNGNEWSITLEIETLENSYDDFSSIETRISDRA